MPRGLYQIYANQYVFLSYINLRAHVQIDDVGLLGFLKLLHWWLSLPLSFGLGLIDTFCLLIVVLLQRIGNNGIRHVELKAPTVGVACDSAQKIY